jgi:hypothetical protein
MPPAFLVQKPFLEGRTASFLLAGSAAQLLDLSHGLGGGHDVPTDARAVARAVAYSCQTVTGQVGRRQLPCSTDRSRDNSPSIHRRTKAVTF